jgi:hypothetical protein
MDEILMGEILMGEFCLASNDGKYWYNVKYLFYDEHNDEFVCLVDGVTCESFQYIKEYADTF